MTLPEALMLPEAVMCESIVKSPAMCNDDDKSFPPGELNPIPALSLLESTYNVWSLFCDLTLKSYAASWFTLKVAPLCICKSLPYIVPLELMFPLAVILD